MALQHAMIYEENELSLRIPADALTFEGFDRWVHSDEFPRFWRIDFLGGEILVVEIVSDSSVTKDSKRLPPFYARAGVRELWLVDARKADLRFDLLTLQDGAYAAVPADADGWRHSPRLTRSFRLVRFHQPPFPWSYRLEHKDA